MCIRDRINIEEKRFLETLDRGEKLLNDFISSGKKLISGSKAFELYDTYGFPLELTKEILEENNINVDLEGFSRAMEAQKERAKAASQKIDLTLKGSIEREIDLFEQTIFKGYDSLNSQAFVKGIFFESNSVEKAVQGQSVQIILDQTSFYGESGGQVGDTGTISGDGTQIYLSLIHI